MESRRTDMRIIVCVKQIAQVYARTGRDPDQRYLSPDDVVHRINPHDEHAMVAALEARKLTGSGEIILLTLGPLIAEGEVRRLAALGAAKWVHMDAADPADSWCKSRLLARAIQRMGADLVLCGTESLDTRNGRMGALLAHHLQRPLLTSVRRVTEVSAGESVTVERAASKGRREIVRCPLPAVFSVEPGTAPLPVPGYAALRRSASLPVETLLVPDEVGLRPKTVRLRLAPPRPRPKAPDPPDAALNSHDRIEQLLTGSRVEKRGELVTGDLASQVERVVSFLQEHEILKTPSRNQKE
jgi:electron transfer flavoprotein beta subunit